MLLTYGANMDVLCTSGITLCRIKTRGPQRRLAHRCGQAQCGCVVWAPPLPPKQVNRFGWPL